MQLFSADATIISIIWVWVSVLDLNQNSGFGCTLIQIEIESISFQSMIFDGVKIWITNNMVYLLLKSNHEK